MSISSIGSMPLNSINFNSISTAPQVSQTQTDTAPNQVAADGFGFSASEAESVPDRSALLKAIQSPQSDSSAPAAAPEEQPETAKAEGTQQNAAIEAPGPNASTEDIAVYCNSIAKSGGSVAQRTELISKALSQGITKADTPNSDWVRANPEQIKLYVQETLEHVDALRQIGQLRGLNFDDHDLEPGTGKFEPRIAQYLALPGREDSVKWSISEHNASPHHATWKDPNASVDDLAESASDIVNAWRMNRRVYDKPSWSWERIADFVDAQFQNNEMSATQREAILQAIPHQMDWEAKFGLPA